jgi:hypothetical protein
MNRLATAVAVAALTAGAVLTAPSATAASTPHDTTVYTQPAPIPAEAKVQQLDCRGTTGDMGCGPGWFWRDGWRGWACYPC